MQLKGIKHVFRSLLNFGHLGHRLIVAEHPGHVLGQWRTSSLPSLVKHPSAWSRWDMRHATHGEQIGEVVHS